MTAAPGLRSGGRLGFACAWEPDRRATWSGTPWHLAEALGQQVPLVDLPVGVPAWARRGLRAVSARRHEGAWVAPWAHTRTAKRWTEQRLRHLADEAGCTAVLEIGDLGPVDQPFFVYQDFSYATFLAYKDATAGGVDHLELRRRELRRLIARQRRIYERCTGVITMSGWLAEEVAAAGVDPARVHVVPPGIALPPCGPVELRDRSDGPRLLFLGRQLVRKGGDLVVEATARLRSRRPTLRLTVAGPRTWPLPGPVPDHVDFLGPVPHDQVPSLHDAHDGLVLPSRLEGYGIAFLESLARGRPCVGRAAYAMPEIIEPGRNGALVHSDDPDELAQVLDALVDDDELYRRVVADAPAVAARSGWDRTATAMLEVVDGALVS